MKSRRCCFLFIALACLWPDIASAPPVAKGSSPDRPRLVVLVVFDQMRGDYLARWQDLYGPDGLKRLMTEGAWFQNCHYPYAYTVTGAGHASMLSGCSPDRHGIVGNDWYDRGEGSSVYCAATSRYQQVPPTAELEEGETSRRKAISGTPDRMLAPTLADVLKAATQGQGLVVALSLKDRSAILTSGRHPDACYWFDSSLGQFVTSTYYRDRAHAWVAAFNAERRADRWFGKDWTRLRPDLDYTRFSGPDDVAAEGNGYDQGRTFPHPTTGGLKQPGKKFYDAVTNSPYGNDLLLDLTATALDAMKLGADEVPDLLSVSFSSNDLIGHTWGSDSHEVLDVTLRSDLTMRKLLGLLDAKVGKGRYTLVLTADHGVCPLPEVSKARGLDAERVPGPSTKQAEALLSKAFGGKPESKTTWIEAVSGPWFYLNRALVKERGADAAKVEETLAAWLRQQQGICAVYTRNQLTTGVPADDAVGQRVRRSFHPDRSGDLFIVLKPYYLIGGPTATGTTHGMPHDYDTHVPLVAFGHGIRPVVSREATTPQAAALILAHVLGVSPPAQAEATLPQALR